MFLHYTFAIQPFGSDPSSEGGDLNAYASDSDVHYSIDCDNSSTDFSCFFSTVDARYAISHVRHAAAYSTLDAHHVVASDSVDAHHTIVADYYSAQQDS